MNEEVCGVTYISITDLIDRQKGRRMDVSLLSITLIFKTHEYRSYSVCSLFILRVGVCGDQETCEGLSFSTTRVVGIELASSGLAVSVRTCWAMGPQSYSYNYTKQSNVFAINYILMN